jgi:Domain of unknown function (DUF4288)
MGYIPPGAEWYLAEIVEEFRIAGESENIVHTNLVLVRADSPDEAFERAEQLGRELNMEYTNPEGKTVTVRYRGLRDLNVIHDKLEHGAELIYQKDVGMTEEELEKWVSSKEELGVFGKYPADGQHT